MPDVEYMAYAIDWYTDGLDNNGNGLVDEDAEALQYTIYAAAKKNDTMRKVEIVYDKQDVNVWRNAIFAGSGQAGGLINGNVSIHGAVHLLGENLVFGASAISALELSGTSLIHNNYEGLDADLRARVPALPQALFEGQVVDTLEANLRVRNGLVALSGNSEIGEVQDDTNDFKETMDGTFVNDGWTGNSVTPDGDRGDPTSVQSDNGWDENYDLGDRVPFPTLADDWQEPVTGTKIMDPETGTWYTHEDYFTEVLLADEVDQNDGTYNGDIVLNARGDDYYWNASTGEELTGNDVASATPDLNNDDFILFDATANMLTMNGQIEINGNLEFIGRGSDTTINYTGRAAILVQGDVTIDTDLLSCNNGDKNDTANSFPANNIIGLMAKGNMYVGSTSQLQIMGAFYAEQMIRSEKQTDIMGTFVSSYFDMGTNVPSIYQVPDLADWLPRGMIGNYPIYSMVPMSWREIR